jgi:hypothetical protein
MSKQTFKLKVPAEPKSEVVSHGNHDFHLVAGEIVETKDPRIARWLEGEHGLELVETIDDPAEPLPPVPPTDPESNDREPEAPATEVDPETYPSDFPGREKLLESNVAFDTVKTSDAEQLVKYPGIGPKTAADIVAYFAAGGTE